jgi:hypothetical protein
LASQLLCLSDFLSQSLEIKLLSFVLNHFLHLKKILLRDVRGQLGLDWRRAVRLVTELRASKRNSGIWTSLLWLGLDMDR